MKKYYYLFGSLLLLLLAWSLYTLKYTPVPWVDEVYFASVTQSFTGGGGLKLPIGLDEDVFHYGPVYFLFTSLSVLIGGFNLISIRIVGLIFTFVVGFILFHIYKIKGVNIKIAMCLVFLMLIDQLFVYCSHIGRMETLALFFYLVAVYFYENNKNCFSYKSIVIVSVSILFAFLTTSRTAVIIIPLALAILIRLFKSKQWGKLSLFIFIPVVGFLIWLFISYGSFSAFINYYTSVDNGYSEGNLINRFIGGTFIISKTHYPLVLGVIIVILHSIKYKYFKSISLYFYTIILFYLIVHSTSDTYSVLILPLYYLILGIGFNNIWKEKERMRIWFYSITSIILLCLVVNLGVFSAKWLLIESSKEYRDKTLVDNWISDKIPKGAVILGSDNYYYSCLDNGCKFKSLTQVYKNDKQFYSFMYDDYKPEYVLYSSKEASPDAIKAFSLLNLEFISHYTPEPIINWQDAVINKLGLENNNTFDGDLYRVIY